MSRLSQLRPPRTLRARLVALLALTLTLGFAAAALVTVLVVRHVLVDRLDAQLRAAGDRFAVGLEHNDHDADNQPGRYGDVEGVSAGTLGARILHGKVTEAAIVGDHDTADHVPARARARLGHLTADTAPRSIVLPGLGVYRVIVAKGRDGDLQVTGLPAGPVERTIDKLLVIESLVFGVTLLVVALVSAGVVRFMLRPLAKIADTATAVSALPLESGGVSLPHRVATDTHGSEVDALARAFNAMLEQVESAFRTRAESEDQLRRFIADASHELRTPVAVVRGHAELAQRAGNPADGTGPRIPPDVVQSLQRITVQAERMGHLVDDLLLLARLDSGRELAHEAVDIARVVLDAIDDARITAEDHHWQLRLPTHSVWVYGDAHALGQAVGNLLTNAALHTPTDTTVTVRVDEGAGGDVPPAARIAVSDNGPGMDADLAAHAFDRFVHGAGPRRAGTSSSGLGLPIVAAIIAAHGGSVLLESTPEGTTVRVSLPIAGALSGSAEQDGEAESLPDDGST